MQDGKNRWAMGALYSIKTLQLLAHFCIQEHEALLDPDKDIEFSKLTFKDARAR